MVLSNNNIGSTDFLRKRILQLKAQNYATLDDVPFEEQLVLHCLLLEEKKDPVSKGIHSIIKTLQDCDIKNNTIFRRIACQCMEMSHASLKQKYQEAA